MGEEKMDVEETTLTEENQEVDASIQLCHKIFALSNPSPGTDVAALSDEVKQIVLDRSACHDTPNPSQTRITATRALAVKIGRGHADASSPRDP
jgi:hypothetical protein